MLCLLTVYYVGVTVSDIFTISLHKQNIISLLDNNENFVPIEDCHDNTDSWLSYQFINKQYGVYMIKDKLGNSPRSSKGQPKIGRKSFSCKAVCSSASLCSGDGVSRRCVAIGAPLRPLHIVCARLAACCGLYDGLQCGPEPQPFQRPVQPASRDAEVGLVRRHVVDAMVAPRQNHVVLLQPHHPPRQSKVRV